MFGAPLLALQKVVGRHSKSRGEEKKTERENLTKTRDSIDKVVCCRVANKYGYITTQINQRGTSRWARYGGRGWYNNRSRVVIDNIQFNGSICPEPCNDELPLIQRHLHG